MTDTMPASILKSDHEVSRHASFILRCWMTEGQQARVRLVDASSGVSYSISDLNALPALLRRLVAEGPNDKE